MIGISVGGYSTSFSTEPFEKEIYLSAYKTYNDTLSSLSNDGYALKSDIPEGPTSLSNYYKKTETSSAVEISTALSSRLESDDVKISYDSGSHTMSLSAGDNVTSIDCTDFIKDGMLESVELCNSILVMTFNTAASAE